MDYTILIQTCYALMGWALEGESEEVDKTLLENHNAVASELPALSTFLKYYSVDEYADLVAIGENLRDKVESAYKRDPSIKMIELDQLGAFQRWFRVRSEPSFRKLEQYAKTQAPDWVKAHLVKEVGSQKPQLDALREIVKRTVGREDTAYRDEDEAKGVREKYPDVYKEYLRLRKDFNQVWKDALTTYVIKSGSKTVPMKEVQEWLEKQGLKTNLPEGFTGRVDGAANLYTDDNILINGRPSAVLFPKVRMNPKPSEDAPWIFQAIRHTGEVDGPYFYTKQFRRASVTKKFEKVGDLIGLIDDMRSKWLQLINNYDVTQPDTGAAVILELLYAFSARIGSIGNEAAGKSTFGLSTLQVKHLKDKDTQMVFKYLGKAGVKTQHVLIPDSVSNRRILKILRSLMANKKPSELLFTYQAPNGKVKRITGAIVNNLFKRLSGRSDITVHKLRTFWGTKLATELIERDLAAGVQKQTTADALEWLKGIAEQVGKKLNHVRRSKEGEDVVTGATALSAYIDVGLQMSIFQRWGLAMPRYLDKMVND